MSISLFSIITLITCGILFVVYKNKISKYYDDFFYFVLALLYISNLGYSHIIQWGMRCFAVVAVWIYILIVDSGKLKLKPCNVARLALFYLFFCVLSTIWSDSPLQTLFKSVELITDLVVIWKLYTRNKDKEIFVVKTINLIMTVSAVLLTITMAGFFLVPSFFANTGYSASHTILGIRIGDGLIGANQTGALAVLVFAWAILLIYKKSIYIYGILFISMISLLFSQSRASLILVPIIIFLRLFKPKAKCTFIYIIIILIVCCIGIKNIDVIIAYVLRGQSSADISSLSGRKMIWSYAFKYFEHRPLLGYGFGAGGEMVGRILPGAFKGFQHMHNGIVETLVGTGLIGCVCIVLQYLYTFIDVSKRVIKKGIKNNLFEIVLIMFFAIRTYTSLGIGSWQSLEIIVWYVFLFSLSAKTGIQGSFKNKNKGGIVNEN